MDNDAKKQDWYKIPSRKTIRLTFRLSDGNVSLLSSERLDMICPPVIGDKPEIGKNGGYWMALFDNRSQLLFHRTLPLSLLNSVEVHSPDGKIRREFGSAKDKIFEVLMPDDDQSEYISLIGEEPDEHKRKAKGSSVSTELARFEIPKNKGGKS